MPDNTPSRSGVPTRLRQAARALKIHALEEISRQAIELERGLDETTIRNLPVECVLVVPDRDNDEGSVDQLSQADRGLPILWRTDFAEDRLTGALRRILGGDQHPPLRQQEQNRVRAVVNPEIILARKRIENLPLFQDQDPEIVPEEVIRVMDREQERVAEHLGPGYRVLRGVAGSGKTLVLVYRARYLRRLWPQLRILVLCYNRVLAKALEVMVETDENLKVININRLAYELTQQNNNRNQRSSSNNRPDFNQQILDASEQAKSMPDSERYDVVLVDEVQDFSHDRLDLAYTMLKSDCLRPDPQRPDRDNFVMAFDVAQNVYRRGGASWKPPGVDAQGRPRTARGRSTVFRKNYRNTREILEFAMNFLAGSREWKKMPVDLDDPSTLIPQKQPNVPGRRHT